MSHLHELYSTTASTFEGLAAKAASVVFGFEVQFTAHCFSHCIVRIFEVCEGFADPWRSFSNSSRHTKRENIGKNPKPLGNWASDAATLAGSATRAPKMPFALQEKAKRWCHVSNPTAFKCNRTSLSLQMQLQRMFLLMVTTCYHLAAMASSRWLWFGCSARDEASGDLEGLRSNLCRYVTNISMLHPQCSSEISGKCSKDGQNQNLSSAP